jgi:iron complex outermembrane receptor protein
MLIPNRFTRGIFSFLALPIAVTVAFSAYSSTAIAQEDEELLDEIIVTSRYREERLQETPIAITAISGQEIELRGLTQGYEVAYVVPNASLRPAQAAFGNTMSAFIRGIGQYDFNFAFEPGVAIYFDDVLYPVTYGSMIELMDLERVEVLRGPQGTLFGRGALGGAIRYVSRQPTGDGTGEVSVTVGSYDRVDVRGSYDFALSETVFARVTGVSQQRGGHQDVFDYACLNPGQTTLPQRLYSRNSGCRLGTQGGQDVTGARGVLRWDVNDDVDITLTADFLNNDSEAAADTLVALATNDGGPFDGQPPVPFNFWEDAQFASYGVRLADFLPPNIYTSYATYSDPDFGIQFVPQNTIKQEGYSGKLDWNLNDQMNLVAVLSYREVDGALATDADAGPLGLQTVDGYNLGEVFTGELRLSGRAMDRLDWTVGYFHYDGEWDNAQQVSIPAFVPGPFLVNGKNVTDAQNDSVYAHLVYDLTDQLAITAGLRYSEDSKDVDFDNTIVVTTGSASDDSTDWKVGIDYQVNDNLLVYGSAATGYRPQAFNPRPFQVTQFVPVDGEENISYDIGVKSDLFDDRLRLNVAAFYIDYKKRILPVGGVECLADANGNYRSIVPEGTPGAVQDSLGQWCTTPPGAFGPTTSRTFYQNVPAEVSGAELEFIWRPVDELTISGIYGYTNFDGDEVSDPSIVGLPPGTVFLNDAPTYVPEDNWNISVSYVGQLPGGGTLTPRVDVYGQSEICPTNQFNFDNPNVSIADRCTDAYELVNVAVEWANPNREWTITVGGTNVTDEEYFLNKFDLTAFGQPTVEGQPGRPAEWFLSLRRNFQ